MKNPFKYGEAIARTGGKDILNKETIEVYNLENIDAIQTDLNTLIEKQVLDRDDDVYWFTDVFFKEWIRRKI